MIVYEAFGVPVAIVKGSAERETWTPTQADLETFEAGFPSKLEKPAHLTQAEWDGRVVVLRRQRRQYTGIEYRYPKKERALFVSFYCNGDHGWGLGPLYISDGGTCYTDVVYHLNSRRYDVILH
jgi:hypothetical protein